MRISNLSKIIPGADEQGISLLSGYQSVWQCDVVDVNNDPVDLTNQTIEVAAEIYTCEITFGARAITIVEGTLTRAVDNMVGVVSSIAADQAATPGRFTITIPSGIINNVELALDSTTRALVVIYIKRTSGNEVRTSRAVIIFGKGQAADAT